MTSEKRREKRAERFAAGKCVTCGKHQPMHYRKQCWWCLEKNKNTLRERRGYIGIPRSERADYDMCWHCGEPVIEGKKVCQKCYDRMLDMQCKGQSAATVARLEREWSYGI